MSEVVHPVVFFIVFIPKPVLYVRISYYFAGTGINAA